MQRRGLYMCAPAASRVRTPSTSQMTDAHILIILWCVRGAQRWSVTRFSLLCLCVRRNANIHVALLRSIKLPYMLLFFMAIDIIRPNTDQQFHVIKLHMCASVLAIFSFNEQRTEKVELNFENSKVQTRIRTYDPLIERRSNHWATSTFLIMCMLRSQYTRQNIYIKYPIPFPSRIFVYYVTCKQLRGRMVTTGSIAGPGQMFLWPTFVL